VKPSGLGIDSQVYQNILDEYLLPFTDQYFPDGFFGLLQDNAPCHRSNLTQS